ncbi:type VII secretion protein EccB [Nocardia farcinica]|uniref:type VII secretion protein EccB n=1 Tax=Nocardia farcinica TaxID=37329 RepID=UPI002457B5E8|nr:type VII secretion protein EccB [Nocardia farcinica]
MPAQLTTRQQVNGYRFLLRRYEHALIRRDVRMLHDPMRSQSRSLIVGAVLGLLVVAGAAIMAFLKPQGTVGDASIVMAKETGALYVVADDRLHPVLNLASARLITGSNEDPTSVKASKLSDRPRGPLLGIPGAPSFLPGSSAGDRSTWSLCDTVTLSPSGRTTNGLKTTAIAGEPDTGAEYAARPLGEAQTLLVTKGDKTYLLYDGKRAEVDPADPVLVRALGLDGLTARPISAGLLNATLEVPPLRAPVIDGLGGPGPGALAEVPVGGVIRVRTVASEDMFVVLADGVQPVSPFAAEVIRTANSQEMADVVAVPPDRLVGVPVVQRLPVDRFPREIPEILTAENAPVGCLTWSRGAEHPAATVEFTAGRGLPLAVSAAPVELATADGSGDRIDAVYIPPGTGEYVQTTGIEPASERRGSLFYIAENGIRYGVPDAQTAAVLGLAETPSPAPWPIIAELVPGPTLNRADALVSHDVLPTGLP